MYWPCQNTTLGLMEGAPRTTGVRHGSGSGGSEEEVIPPELSLVLSLVLSVVWWQPRQLVAANCEDSMGCARGPWGGDQR